MKLRELRISEAPIGDINHIGNWDKGSSFRKEVDRRLVTNPRMIERMKTACLKTNYDFQLFFVNHPEGYNHVETGCIGSVDQSYMWFQNNMPSVLPEILQLTRDGKGLNGDSLNIIYTNNRAGAHVPMTPWIIAHRMAHALRRDSRRNSRSGLDHYYQEAYNGLIRDTGDLLRDYYQIGDHYIARREEHFSRDAEYGRRPYSGAPPGTNWNRIRELVYRGFWEQLGTFRSAREKNLREQFEMLNECFAQYLIQGEVKFNPPPTQFTFNAGPRYGNHKLYASLQDQESISEAAQHVETMARTLTYQLDAMVGAHIGDVFVM